MARFAGSKADALLALLQLQRQVQRMERPQPEHMQLGGLVARLADALRALLLLQRQVQRMERRAQSVLHEAAQLPQLVAAWPLGGDQTETK